MASKRRPSVPPPLSGESGLPDLGSLDPEVTATRQTDTNLSLIPSSTSKTRPTLTVLTGFDAGRLVVVTHEMIVGRASDSPLLLSDPGVSRAHARLVRRGFDLFIYDADSKNGTFVGDVRVGPGGKHLQPHDVIRFGPHVSVRYAEMTRAEEKLARDLYNSSMRDPLTRTFNRRYLANRLRAEVAYVVRHGGPLSVLMYDLDHFKKLNDEHGHSVGDAMLRASAAAVTTTLRSEDVLARVGGEEFVILLRGISREAAVACGERVRAAVERVEVSADGLMVRATLSAGVATSDEGKVDAAGNMLLKLADTRLYEAKARGRNRVVGASFKPR